MTTTPLHLMGVAEAARHLGVSRQRVSNLRKRHPGFPDPVALLSTGPVWLAQDIEAFALIPRKVGRPRKEKNA